MIVDVVSSVWRLLLELLRVSGYDTGALACLLFGLLTHVNLTALDSGLVQSVHLGAI